MKLKGVVIKLGMRGTNGDTFAPVCEIRLPNGPCEATMSDEHGGDQVIGTAELTFDKPSGELRCVVDVAPKYAEAVDKRILDRGQYSIGCAGVILEKQIACGGGKAGWEIRKAEIKSVGVIESARSPYPGLGPAKEVEG